MFQDDGKFEGDCKENEATNLIKCDQPVIMLVEGVYLNAFTFFNHCKVILVISIYNIIFSLT